jgi:hypothetical protein
MRYPVAQFVRGCPIITALKGEGGISFRCADHWSIRPDKTVHEITLYAGIYVEHHFNESSARLGYITCQLRQLFAAQYHDQSRHAFV